MKTSTAILRKGDKKYQENRWFFSLKLDNFSRSRPRQLFPRGNCIPINEKMELRKPYKHYRL